MTEIAARSIDVAGVISRHVDDPDGDHVYGWRVFATFFTLFLIAAILRSDRLLPLIMPQKIKADSSFRETRIGSITGVAFAVFYWLLSLPRALAADLGSPRFVLIYAFWAGARRLRGRQAGERPLLGLHAHRPLAAAQVSVLSNPAA